VGERDLEIREMKISLHGQRSASCIKNEGMQAEETAEKEKTAHIFGKRGGKKGGQKRTQPRD